MKKLFFTMALLLCAVAASAQVVAVVDHVVLDKQLPQKRGFAGYETNRFWDNFEIAAAGGAQILTMNGTFGDNDYGERMKAFNWQASFGITKWYHPVIGTRLQVQGGQYQNLTRFEDYMKNPYIFTHFDFMLNFSNWVGGERDDRAYYAIPFAGFGWHISQFTDDFQERWRGYNLRSNNTYAFTAGLLNKFRLAPGLDLEIELKTWIMPNSELPEILMGGTDRAAVAYSATLGLAYRFNNRGFRQASPYTVEDVLAYQIAVAERDRALMIARAENAELANDLADAEAARRRAESEAAAAKKALELAKWGPNSVPADQFNNTPAYTEDIYMTARGITFFTIGSSKLTDKEKLRLDIIAAQIKDAPADKVFLIEGHADRQTGTHAINTRLADKRAQNVFDYLVSKGVNPRNLSYKGYSDTKNPFPKAEQNRVALLR